MNSIKKKSTKKFKNIDSDNDNLIEELEAYSALSNGHKDTNKKKTDSKKQDVKKPIKQKTDSKKQDVKKLKKQEPKKQDKKPIKQKTDSKKNFKVNTDDEKLIKKKKNKKYSDSSSDSDDNSDSSDDSSSSENSKYDNNDVTLVNAVKKWVKADDRQRELRKNTIEKKKENDKLNSVKKESSNIITKAMADEDLPKITISKGKLLLNKTTSKEKYSAEVIEAALTKKYPKKKVDEIIDLIENEREDVIKYNIKRVGN